MAVVRCCSSCLAKRGRLLHYGHKRCCSMIPEKNWTRKGEANTAEELLKISKFDSIWMQLENANFGKELYNAVIA